jgi:hypothetical protein
VGDGLRGGEAVVGCWSRPSSSRGQCSRSCRCWRGTPGWSRGRWLAGPSAGWACWDR